MLVVLVPASPPAYAAISRVGVVSFTGASTTSLTLNWPETSGAKGYRVWRSIHKDMAHRRVARSVSGSAATVSGLKPGQTYCFQVQGKSGSKLGPAVGGHLPPDHSCAERSHRTGVQGDELQRLR